jgi:hypothetical protein
VKFDERANRKLAGVLASDPGGLCGSQDGLGGEIVGQVAVEENLAGFGLDNAKVFVEVVDHQALEVGDDLSVVVSTREKKSRIITHDLALLSLITVDLSKK